MKLLILSNFPIPEVQKRRVEAIRGCAGEYEVAVTSDREAQLEEIVDADIVFGTISPALRPAAATELSSCSARICATSGWVNRCRVSSTSGRAISATGSDGGAVPGRNKMTQ